MGKRRCKNRICKFYHCYTWVEPPLDEESEAKPHTEEECNKAKHYFLPTCGGVRKNCNLGEGK